MVRRCMVVGFGLLVAALMFACAQDTPLSPADQDNTLNADPSALSKAAAAVIKLEVKLRATPAGGVASGKAKFEDRGSRRKFSTEVEDVSTRGNHPVKVNGSTVGMVNVNALGFGDLNLDTANGQTVPKMKSGDLVEVFNPSGKLILSGKLAPKP